MITSTHMLIELTISWLHGVGIIVMVHFKQKHFANQGQALSKEV